jgi:3-oxoacyl-[acyl-carrier protein] reductase
MRLKDKIAVITGGGTGIGRAAAVLFAKEGATVMVAGRRPQPLEETVKAITAGGGKAVCQTCDVSDRAQVESMIDTAVKRFGRLDVMVNNAGVNSPFGAERVTVERFLDETWDQIMKIDLNGTFYGCRAAAAQMVKQRSGSIINVSSVAGVVALRLQIGFVAAKAAVIKLTEAMACELGPHGIRVNCLSPGSVDVSPGQLSKVPEKQGGFLERAQNIASFIPQGRLGMADEQADALLFLASDESSYVNGHNLVVDGGWTCGFNRDW